MALRRAPAVAAPARKVSAARSKASGFVDIG